MLMSQEKLEKVIVSDHQKTMQEAKPSKDIAATLQERGDRYGPFDGHARITQSLKDCMSGKYQVTNWDVLKPEQKEALEMIAHKIGRILNGDPNYDDNWRDIAGYAQLIVNQLESK